MPAKCLKQSWDMGVFTTFCITSSCNCKRLRTEGASCWSFESELLAHSFLI